MASHSTANAALNGRGRKNSVISGTQRDSLLQSPDQFGTISAEASPTLTKSSQDWSQRLTRSLSRQVSAGINRISPPDLPSLPRTDTSTSSTPADRSSSEEIPDRPKTGSRKKSGFSSFVNNLVGGPKKPVISAPANPVHVTHVGYDAENGQFEVGMLHSPQLTFADNHRVCPFRGSKHSPSRAYLSRSKGRIQRLSLMS